MIEEMTASNTIEFDDFLKIDIRAGKITAAERVLKSDKLLKLTVDFGAMGSRQIIAGIGKSYSPEVLVGTITSFVVNLAPRKLMGLESHGMILAGENLLTPGDVTISFFVSAVTLGGRVG